MNDNLRSKEVLDTTTWKAYLKANFPYPQEAIDAGIEGRHYFEFETDETGIIRKLRLLRSYEQELSIPIAHFLNSAPGIIPPKNETGKLIPQKYYLILNFKLVY